jgi:hypothetical protein
VGNEPVVGVVGVPGRELPEIATLRALDEVPSHRDQSDENEGDE